MSELTQPPCVNPHSLDYRAGYAAACADMERGVRPSNSPDRPGDVWPDWVYEARSAIRHQNESIPWLRDLLDALGWQGGTVHAAMQAVRRLVSVAEYHRDPDGWVDRRLAEYRATPATATSEIQVPTDGGVATGDRPIAKWEDRA